MAQLQPPVRPLPAFTRVHARTSSHAPPPPHTRTILTPYGLDTAVRAQARRRPKGLLPKARRGRPSPSPLHPHPHAALACSARLPPRPQPSMPGLPARPPRNPIPRRAHDTEPNPRPASSSVAPHTLTPTRHPASQAGRSSSMPTTTSGTCSCPTPSPTGTGAGRRAPPPRVIPRLLLLFAAGCLRGCWAAAQLPAASVAAAAAARGSSTASAHARPNPAPVR